MGAVVPLRPGQPAPDRHACFAADQDARSTLDDAAMDLAHLVDDLRAENPVGAGHARKAFDAYAAAQLAWLRGLAESLGYRPEAVSAQRLVDEHDADRRHPLGDLWSLVEARLPGVTVTLAMDGAARAVTDAAE